MSTSLQIHFSIWDLSTQLLATKLIVSEVGNADDNTCNDKRHNRINHYHKWVVISQSYVVPLQVGDTMAGGLWIRIEIYTIYCSIRPQRPTD